MRKIVYKTLTIQNFLSIGNDSVVIDFQKGLNIIKGKNIDNPERQNGTGKSAIIEGFYYALFGKTIRDIKKDFVINNITRRKGFISLLFDVHSEKGVSTYRIERTLKPSKVTLYRCGENEDEDITKDSITNTNKYICQLIGSNSSISKSCDILSLSDNTPFMAKKAEEKRKFIEDIFNLEVFGRMMKDLKAKIRDCKSDLSVSTARLEEIDSNIDNLTQKLKEMEERHLKRKEELEKRKTELEKKIKSLKKKIDEVKIPDIDDLKTEKNKLVEEIEEQESQMKELEVEKSVLNNELKSLEREKEKCEHIEVGVVCDKCLRKIPKTHEKVLKKMAGEYEEKIKDIQEKRDTIQSKIYLIDGKRVYNRDKKKELADKIQSALLLMNSLKSDKAKLKEYLLNRKALVDDIDDSDTDLKSFEKNVKDLELRREEEKENYDTLKVVADDLETCKFILGEEGVKSFLIKRLISMLNGGIQKYIDKLGMSMRCKFDEYFDEKITTGRGKEVSYWNFSGGERRTVDLACAWAFKDIKRKLSGVSSNVEFLDEIFDAAFDERGFDLLIEVLKERIDKDGLSCYAISHRKEALKHVDGEIVEVEKENGITRRTK